MPVSFWRLRLTPLLCAATLAVLLSGCSASTQSPSAGNARVAPPPEVQQPVQAGAPAASAPAPSVLSSSDLLVAYRAILDRFVDPVDSAEMVRTARDTLRETLQTQALLPLFTAPLDLMADPTGNPQQDWASFAAAYDAVTQKLPAWASESRPDWQVLRKMLARLGDGHSTFLTPDEVRRRNETTFAGIGVQLSRGQEGQLPLIAEVYPNTPAFAAGVKSGDRIVRVDGQELAGRPLAEVVDLIRGPVNSALTLTLRRTSTGEQRDVRITRARVQIEQTQGGLIANTVGYLRIRSFSEETAQQAVGILGIGLQRGVRGWVVDLRSNPGGALTAVQQVAGAFVENREIGRQVNRARENSPIMAQGPMLIQPNTPVVILVNGDTASGGEILSAALQEYGIAQLVGTTTAGSVGVASVLGLADGSQVQITGQRYVTPRGVQIDKVGVSPDQVVTLTDADLEAGRDPQLQRAVEVVAQKLKQS